VKSDARLVAAAVAAAILVVLLIPWVPVKLAVLTVLAAALVITTAARP
jgi:hypothetical protein